MSAHFKKNLKRFVGIKGLDVAIFRHRRTLKRRGYKCIGIVQKLQLKCVMKKDIPIIYSEIPNFELYLEPPHFIVDPEGRSTTIS